MRAIRRTRLSSRRQSNPEEPPCDRYFEQIYLFGASPTGDHRDPYLLGMYPSTNHFLPESETEQIRDLCFPEGLLPISTQTSSDPILKQFVFYLQQKSARLYGICVHVSSVPSFSSNLSRNYPVCLCMVCKSPYLSSQIQIVSYLGLVLAGQVSRGSSHLAVAERQPVRVSGMCHRSLSFDRKFPGIAVLDGLHCPALFFAEIVYLQNLSVSGMEALDLTGNIRLDPPGDLGEVECLTWPTLQVLFSALPPEAIALLYSAILQEHRILMVSSDVQKVSMCVIAAAALIAPFKMAAIVLPVVPGTERFRALVDLPVPYLIGSTTRGATADVVVDLDSGEVLCAVEVLMVPAHHRLVERIEQLILQSRKEIEIPTPTIRSFLSQRPNPGYRAFFKTTDGRIFPSLLKLVPGQRYVFTSQLLDSVLSLFYSHVLCMVEAHLLPCVVTDSSDTDSPVRVLNVEVMLQQFAEQDRPFWTNFFRTQSFEVFSNRMLKDLQKPAVSPRRPRSVPPGLHL
jgi:hypothetical protein